MQRDRGRREHWAISNGRKPNQCQVLHLGQSHAGHKPPSGEEQPENSPGERGPRVSVDSGRHRSWGRARQPRGPQTRHRQPAKRGDDPARFTMGITTPRVPCRAQGPAAQAGGEGARRRLEEGSGAPRHSGERLRTLGLSRSERRRPRGDLVALYSSPRRGHREGGAELFSLGSRDRRCGKGSKLCQGRFGQGMSEHFGTQRAVKRSKGPPRGTGDAPCLAVRKRHLDDAHTLTFGQPGSGQAVGPDHHFKSLPTEMVYSSGDFYGLQS